MPGVDTVGIDVLGLGGGSDGSMVSQSMFDEDDVFELEAEDMNGDLTQLTAGPGITSLVLQGEGGGKGLDWAAELLLFTHEPLRRDMLEMQRALQPRFFGELPDSWRVRSFFRFYQAWCALVSQQHAVEVSVHYDWLAAPTGKMQGEHRTELLSYHRTIELELLAISRLEHKIIEELTSAADWTTSEPWSEQAEELRKRLTKLCAQIRLHLATQESALPEIFRAYWGDVSPPELVTRSLAAAKQAQAAGAKAPDKPKLLMWTLHYLDKRSPKRAEHIRGALPVFKRFRNFLVYDTPHSKILQHLRLIINDTPPVETEQEVAKHRDQMAAASGGADDDDEGAGPKKGTVIEQQRKAGMVNAVLAAANARRVDVPFNDNAQTRTLAVHEAPLHTFKMDGRWAEKAEKVPDNLYKKIGIERVKTPRRL